MRKITLILAVAGMMVIGSSLGALAMMGGGHGYRTNYYSNQGSHSPGNHMNQGTFTHGYVRDSGYHMSFQEMETAHNGNYPHNNGRNSQRRFSDDRRHYNGNQHPDYDSQNPGQYRRYYNGN